MVPFEGEKVFWEVFITIAMVVIILVSALAKYEHINALQLLEKRLRRTKVDLHLAVKSRSTAVSYRAFSVKWSGSSRLERSNPRIGRYYSRLAFAQCRRQLTSRRCKATDWSLNL
jgi:hypothetical protein